MRVHVTRKDFVYGRISLGDFEVEAETTSYYRIKDGWSQIWVAKSNCEIVKEIKNN